MKKQHTMEIIAILSLSLILTSSLSVSGTVPAMLEYFSDYSRASVEFLISIPAIAMTVMVALSPIVSKFISERVTLISGLIIAGFGGIAPFFFTTYRMVLFARIVMGLGLGLLNTRAISIIGERFSGETRAKLLGYRLSAETIGPTVMTLVAGQLLVFGWRAPYLVYGISFLILVLYLLFVPAKSVQEGIDDANREAVNERLTEKQFAFVLMNAVFIGLLISTNVANALRIPSYVVENGLGTAVQANRILSLSMFAGFLAGLVFGKLLSQMKKNFLPFFLLTGALGLVLIPVSSTIVLITAAAFICGFSITNCVSYVFTNLSEQVPVASLNTANAIVLVGCNLGATIAPMLLNWIGFINPNLSTSFFVYSFVYAAIAVGTFLFSKVSDRKNVNRIEEK